MTVPQSVLAVALAALWLVVLVPTSSRRRRKVSQTVEGAGFRVLGRGAKPTSRKRLRRRRADRGAMPARGRGEAMTTDQDFRDHPAPIDEQADERAEHPVEAEGAEHSELAASDDGEVSTAEMADGTASVERETERAGASPVFNREAATAASAEAEGDRVGDSTEHPGKLSLVESSWDEVTESTSAFEAPVALTPSDETRTGRTRSGDELPEDAHRPIPRRPGRGTFDPESDAKSQAYKYSRRRRVLSVLVLLTAGFAGLAFAAAPSLWVAAGVSAVLLVLFLVYLRRQVRIENEIRQRRLAKLQRARQLRPEWAAQQGGREGSARAGTAPRRVGRAVLDLDDEDPSFEHLEQFEAVEHRHAVGQ
jgi:hypothetical protein